MSTQKRVMPLGATVSSVSSVSSEICASVKIVGLCVLNACIFGIINDQITVRICFEYFSEGFHKEMVKGTWAGEFLGRYSDSPTIWGATWGIIATWWVGAILGVILSVTSRMRSWPRLSSKNLALPVFVCISLLGLTVFLLTLLEHNFGEKIPSDQLVQRLVRYGFYIEDYNPAIHKEMARKYLLCAFIHKLDYWVGLLYGLAMILWSLYKRYSLKCSKTIT